MTYKVVISEIASKNIEEAVAYYVSEVSKKVAAEFLNDFQKVYKALRKNPYYKRHDSNYRYLPFKKFPFIVFFIIEKEMKTVKINAVFHTSQNPEKYPK